MMSQITKANLLSLNRHMSVCQSMYTSETTTYTDQKSMRQ